MAKGERLLSLSTVEFKLDAKKSTEVGKVNVKGEVCPKGADMAPRHSSTQRKSADIYANLEKITKAKYVAEQAIKDRKVFRLDGGHRYFRQALKDRGWVEKFTPKTKRFGCGEIEHKDEKDDEQTKELSSHLPLDDFDMLVSRALRDHEPDLQFIPLHRISFNKLGKDILLNHFPKASFVTKTGLTSCLKELTWLSDRHCDEFYPRCYILGDEEDNEAFRDDFRRCAITAFFKNCLEQIESEKHETLDESQFSWVKSDSIAFALEMFNQHYNTSTCYARSTCSTIMKQKNLDNESAEEKKAWNNFIETFYKVAYKGFLVQGAAAYEMLIKDAINVDAESNPQAHIEGQKNLWIIKPGAMSRGRGIGVYNNLRQIIELLGPDLSVIANNKWVAQKYIERPLLIHHVKFDIRQWFVITDWGQLTVWMYKRAYVRFATTKFTLDRLDTQTHLTNNAIQKNLEMDDDIVDDVPDDKMWFSEDLDQYLKDCGYGAVWDKKIVPGMKRILTESCLSGQDAAEPRKNSFEIYGADFMLDELLNPWLIEINQGPTMSTSTTVTNELVQEMTDDLFKIILDRRQSYRSHKPSTPDTGNFELIFRQGPVECPRYIGNALNIEGKGLIKPRPRQRTFIKQVPVKPSSAEGDGENTEEVTETRVYSWDVDRINRLAQPRNIQEREKEARKATDTSPNVSPSSSRTKASTSKATLQASTNNSFNSSATESPSTQNILKKLRKISEQAESKRWIFQQQQKLIDSSKSSDKDRKEKIALKKLGQLSTRDAKKKRSPSRRITPRKTVEEALSEKDDAVPTAKSGGASEQNLQIAADLELARKRCATIRTRPLEHQILYPLGLTEGRFKIHSRAKARAKARHANHASLRAYRRNLNSLEMLAQSKNLLQTSLTPSKVTVSPTVYPFVDHSGVPSKIEERMPFQSLPVIIPPTGAVRTPKHMRQVSRVPSQRIDKRRNEQYCIKIPL